MNSLLLRESKLNSQYSLFLSGLTVLIFCCIISGLIWWGEEPSAIATLLCSISVCSLGFFLIIYSHKHGAIAQPGFWLIAFGLRILLATIIVGIFWYQPDLFHRSGYFNSFDPVRWDARGEQLALDGIFGSTIDIHRYGKEGITYYIAIIYSIFGVSCIYISWVNALLSLCSFLVLSYWLREKFGSFRHWDLLSLGLFIPESLWYGSLALKEIHIGFFFILYMVSFYNLFLRDSKQITIKWISIFIFSISGIFVFQRMHFVTLFGFSLLSILITKKIRKVFQIITILILFTGIIYLEPFFLRDKTALEIENFQTITALISGTGAEKFDVGGKSINSLLIPNNFYERIAFSFPRTVFYMVAPFPRLEIWSYWKNLDLWQSIGTTSTRVSVVLFLFFLPAFVASIDKAFNQKEFFSVRWVILIYMVGLFSMANGVMMLHERWRSSLWPFWLVLILIGWPYRRKYYWVIPVCVVAGGISFFLLKAFL